MRPYKLSVLTRPSQARLGLQRHRKMKTTPLQVKQTLLLVLFAALASGRAMGLRLSWCLSAPSADDHDHDHCLSWRVAVETNNIRAWRTVPARCLRHVESYMLGGQHSRDVSMVIDQMYTYMRGIPLSGDGRDAWVLDVDDTCISNLPYYEGKRFGGDPFDPMAFKIWAQRGVCRTIPAMLQLFNDLVAGGFKVFLLTGRDEETMALPTIENLQNEGFIGYERLIMRGQAYTGKSAIFFKSEMRKQLVKEGYRIWGNVGDQWSDLLGDCVGDRTFKIPNPMYFVP